MNKEQLYELYRAEHRMLRDLDPNYFLTFNFGYRLNSITANGLIKHWFNSVQRILYGPAWAKQFDRPWPTAHCYLEHGDTNPHKHCLVLMSKGMGRWAEVHGNDRWKQIARRGQLDVQEIHDLSGVIGYCLKDYIRGGGYADVYVYKDTRAKTIGKSTMEVGRES